MTCLFDLSTLCYIAAYQAYPPIDRDPWLSQLPVKMCPPKLACVAWMLLTAFVHNMCCLKVVNGRCAQYIENGLFGTLVVLCGKMYHKYFYIEKTKRFRDR